MQYHTCKKKEERNYHCITINYPYNCTTTPRKSSNEIEILEQIWLQQSSKNKHEDWTHSLGVMGVDESVVREATTLRVVAVQVVGSFMVIRGTLLPPSSFSFFTLFSFFSCLFFSFSFFLSAFSFSFSLSFLSFFFLTFSFSFSFSFSFFSFLCSFFCK